MKNISLGILAHVDSGKTTLSEALMYKTNQIKKLGRVDNKDAFLDTDKQEKSRGITIFSKQAIFPLGDLTVYLQDTPGHVDFSSEMERCLAVLDYAILVISAPDGIQAHTKLLLSLLESHNIPFFVFVNKTDLPYAKHSFPDNWLNFEIIDYELLALYSEAAQKEYEENGIVSDNCISEMIENGLIHPVLYGSALKLQGVDELLSLLQRFCIAKNYPKEFGAKCFKISRDENGNRLCWIRITGGSISVRDTVEEEKITQIRLYSGTKYENIKTAESGMICAVCGPENLQFGQGLGFEEDFKGSQLVPVLSYSVKILDGTDLGEALKKLKLLAEEDPLLNIYWDYDCNEIKASLMGPVQIDVLKNIIDSRFGIAVSIEKGEVLYKETIKNAVLGIGHFEPLRHYAEVHLLIEPLPSGSGIILESLCSEDLLDRNWQRLIMHNLSEYTHRGVLTGAPLTDVKISIVAGRAHLKHTEGGDFRQASLRAIRQGLMKAENILLEPYYSFEMELPPSQIGRAISDLKSFGAVTNAPEQNDDFCKLSGIAPVSEMSNYQTDFLSYTKGLGKLSLRFEGYHPCHNAKEIIESIGYNPDRDSGNPSSSVFCSHGSGKEIKWDLVDDFAHMDSGISIVEDVPVASNPKLRSGNIDFDDKVLEEIMQREFGEIKRPKYSCVVYEPEQGYIKPKQAVKKEYIIVDGYNMLYAWESLKNTANENLAVAREGLIDLLINYKGMSNCEMYIIFDGYKLKGNQGSVEERNGITIVYTKEGESADAYIEGLAVKLGKNYNISIVSSDSLVQLAALRSGIKRMSASELEYLVFEEKQKMKEILMKYNISSNKIGDIATFNKN